MNEFLSAFTVSCIVIGVCFPVHFSIRKIEDFMSERFNPDIGLVSMLIYSVFLLTLIIYISDQICTPK